jgi:hypothetical protein
MMNRMWRLFFWVTLMCGVLPSGARAQGDDWQVGATPTFSTGKYGTDTRTEVVYTPIIARRLFADGDVTLVVPHICISGDPLIAIVGGTPVRTTTTPERPMTRETAGRGATANATLITDGTAPKARTCGFGDLVVRGRYYLIDERSWIPTLAVRGHLKVPTADQTRGLGTGKPDEGVALEISRTLGRGFTVMTDAGYTIMGKPVGLRFRNAWWYDAGVAQDLANGVVNLSIFFEEYRSVVPDFEDARDILLSLGLKSAGGWRVQLSGEFGLSDGAPDHGITFGASRRF